MMHDDDRDLRERFAELRREDAPGVPSYEAARSRAARRHRRPPRSVRMAGRLLAATAALLLLGVGIRVLLRDTPRPVVDLSVTAWRAPTDFLLRLPGEQSLRTVPTLGELRPEWRNP